MSEKYKPWGRDIQWDLALQITSELKEEGLALALRRWLALSLYELLDHLRNTAEELVGKE